MSDTEHNEFVPVPLPFQIPEPPDLSKIPLSVIHSATVETLISQTEDLSARLKVQIRRNAVMERRALELEENTKNQEKQVFNLQQQLEIVSEKESTHTDKIKNLEATLSHYKSEVELLEVRYAEQTQFQRAESANYSSKITDLEKQVAELSRLLPLEKENFKLADENSFFKTKIEELCNHLQNKESEIRDLKEHTIKLESYLNEKTSENTHLKKQFETQSLEMKKQIDIHNKIIEEKSELENIIILKDREKEHSVSTITNELMTHRQELKQIQMAYRSLQSERTQIESQLRSSEESLNSLSKDNSDLEKQIQNLQSLWYKLQAEFEKERTKTTALTKLNRELSVELQRTKTSPQHDEDFFKRYMTNARNMDV